MRDRQFFGVLSRMKHINRWGLMRNVKHENLCEHSFDVAVIAHALAIIKNKRFDGAINCERVAMLALYHDCSEIITGDMPTPIKYYSKTIETAYKEVEHIAINKLLSYLPDDLRGEYDTILNAEDIEKDAWKIVKAADRISALIKCIEERVMGNRDFIKAEEGIKKSIEALNMPEVDAFMEEFLPAFSLTLDEQA